MRSYSVPTKIDGHFVPRKMQFYQIYSILYNLDNNLGYDKCVHKFNKYKECRVIKSDE